LHKIDVKGYQQPQ